MVGTAEQLLLTVFIADRLFSGLAAASAPGLARFGGDGWPGSLPIPPISAPRLPDLVEPLLFRCIFVVFVVLVVLRCFSQTLRRAPSPSRSGGQGSGAAPRLRRRNAGAPPAIVPDCIFLFSLFSVRPRSCDERRYGSPDAPGSGTDRPLFLDCIYCSHCFRSARGPSKCFDLHSRSVDTLYRVPYYGYKVKRLLRITVWGTAPSRRRSKQARQVATTVDDTDDVHMLVCDDPIEHEIWRHWEISHRRRNILARRPGRRIVGEHVADLNSPVGWAKAAPVSRSHLHR